MSLVNTHRLSTSIDSQFSSLVGYSVHGLTFQIFSLVTCKSSLWSRWGSKKQERVKDVSLSVKILSTFQPVALSPSNRRAKILLEILQI